MDHITAIGHVRVIKRDKCTGQVLFDQTFKNQITNFARQQVAAIWTGKMPGVPAMIAVGTGSPGAGQTGTSPNDTALWAELARKNLDYATVWLQYYSQFGVTFQQSEALGTVSSTNTTGQVSITEAGLFDANGNLWSHVQLSNVTHDNQATLSIQWQVLQQGN